MREREVDSEGEGDDEAEKPNRKWQSFEVESKTFEVEVEKKRGKTLLFIVESKNGVSSWVKMGSASVGMFLEGMDQCIKDGKDVKWEKGWKEKGRRFSMVREANKAGSFIRLGIVDAEEKWYSICIPKGKGGREGWTVMAKVVRNLFTRVERREINKDELSPNRAPSEKGERGGRRSNIGIRMEVKEEESCRNEDRLGQCLIGKWDPKVAGGGDLERMGWMLASVWGLKGKLGLAWMDEGRALLEFEKAAEARKILDGGARLVGGIQVELKVWSPCFGCLEEGDLAEEAWVRVKGLPLSLWTPSILRRVGDVCGGFVAMDGPTERIEDLRWARLLVRTKRGVWPNSIEIEADKTTYLLPMWWEVRPLFRKKAEDRRSAEGCEEGDDGDTRAGRRVEEWSSADIEAQFRSGDVMDGLPDGKGRVLSGGRIRFGSLIREPENGADEGLNPCGPIRPNVRLGIRRGGGLSPTPISGASSGGLGPTGRL